MSSIVRVTEVQINNLKNVKKGQFYTNSNFNHLSKADVVGFYGQNGSGKTAVVEAFKLLEILLSADRRRRLANISEHLVLYGEEVIKLKFDFIVKNNFGEFFVKYSVTLGAGQETLQVIEEEVFYRENEKNKRFKELVSKRSNNIAIRNKSINEMNESERVSVMVANKMSIGNSSSFVFREELKEAFEIYFNDIEKEIMKNLTIDFYRDLHVIDTKQYGLLVANLIMPFSVHVENKRGNIPYEMQDTMILPIEIFKIIEEVIEQINIVLQTIIPGLQIKVRQINVQKLDDGSDGMRFEFLSKRGKVELPLRCESEGILKIISILSTLIAVYNNSNACVVIDELDAGIFEYLLGELLEVISENGQGQLIFTSHNLRILEVLPIKNLWFTTLNEKERYLQLKGVKKLSNARDIYLRAIQLGGQDEAIYAETNIFDIKTSFRKAGIPNVN